MVGRPLTLGCRTQAYCISACSYIIDLENVKQTSDPHTFIPETHFFNWEIAGPGEDAATSGVDSTVPCDRKYIRDPGDEVLEKWAADGC